MRSGGWLESGAPPEDACPLRGGTVCVLCTLPLRPTLPSPATSASSLPTASSHYRTQQGARPTLPQPHPPTPSQLQVCRMPLSSPPPPTHTPPTPLLTLPRQAHEGHKLGGRKRLVRHAGPAVELRRPNIGAAVGEGDERHALPRQPRIQHWRWGRGGGPGGGRNVSSARFLPGPAPASSRPCLVLWETASSTTSSREALERAQPPAIARPCPGATHPPPPPPPAAAPARC